jgi:hypothetical protein
MIKISKLAPIETPTPASMATVLELDTTKSVALPVGVGELVGTYTTDVAEGPPASDLVRE